MSKRTNILNKKQLRQLLVQDELDQLSQELLKSTEASQQAALYNAALLQANRWEQYEKDRNSGAHSYEQLRQFRTQIGVALLEIVNDLPNEIPMETGSGGSKKAISPTGVKLHSLKMQVIGLLFFSKIAICFYLLTHWEAGGFTKEQFIGTLTFLVSIFSTHLALAIKDVMDAKDKKQLPDALIPRKSRNFQRFVYGTIIGYVLVMVFIIGLKPPGTLDYTGMSMLLTLAESSFGVYLATVVMGQCR